MSVPTQVDRRPPGQRPDGLLGAARPPRWQPGEIVLGGLCVEGVLGEGAFSRVYRMSIDEPVRREYAVKQLVFADELARFRSLRELQTWVDLPEHPNLVTLRFPHFDEDSLLLFADCIDGGSLLNWLEAREQIWRSQGTGVDLATVLDIAIQFAWGLHACHAWGLVHADVKPANAFVTRGGIVKVGDFGVSLFKAHPEGIEYSLGSPGFRSPEQEQRRALSTRSDLWSWAASVTQLFALPDGALRPWLPEAPQAVSQMLRNCMHRHPSRRPASALTVASRLRRLYRQLLGFGYPRDEPAFPVRAAGSLAPHDRRGRRGEHWADAQALLATQAGEAELQLPREGVGRRAQAVAELLAQEQLRRHLELRLEDRQLELGERQVLTCALARVLTDMVVIHEQLDDTLGELRQAQRAIELMRPLASMAPAYRAELARAHTGYGVALQSLGRGEIAIGAFDAALELLQPLVLEYPEFAKELSRAHMSRGVVLLDLADAVGSLAACDAAVAIRTPLAAASPEHLAGLALAQSNRANALYELDRFEDAIAAYNEAIKRFESLLPERPEVTRNLALSFSNRGTLQLGQGMPDAAIASFDAAIALYRPLADEALDAAESLAWVEGNKGTALLASGDAATATQCHERTVAAYRRLVLIRPELVAELAGAHLNLGSARLALGTYPEAADSADSALAIYASLASRKPDAVPLPQHGIAHVNKAEALLALGDRQGAQVHHDLAIDLLERRVDAGPYWNNRNELAKAHRAKAAALRVSGAMELAIPHFVRAIALWEQDLHRVAVGSLTTDLGATYAALADLYTAQGRAHEAQELLTRRDRLLEPPAAAP